MNTFSITGIFIYFRVLNRSVYSSPDVHMSPAFIGINIEMIYKVYQQLIDVDTVIIL